MEPPVLNKPKVNITPKITKISSLAQSAEEIKKTSTKLRKTFESGAYQKKTQLTVLNRYKKRLDSIQKQNDKRFLKKQRVKIKLPEIKKFAGSFFTAGSDPLKSIGALAAFNALSKGAKGDILGALGPALVAAGIFFGPSLLRGGASAIRNRGGGTQSQTTATSGGGLFRGTPYAETRAGKSYASMQQFRNMPKWAQGLSRSSAGRFVASNERIIQGTANIGDKLRVGSRGMGVPGIGGIAENIAARGGGPAAQAATARSGGTVAAKLGGVGARAVPLLGTALNLGLSAYRFGQGDVVGGILSALSAIPVVGWAALAVDLAREFGAFDGTFLGRSGKDKLQQQTEEQKKLVDKKEGGTLTFGKSLDRYERVVNKFEQISKGFKITAEGEFDEPPMPAPTQVAPDAGYDGPISGDTFFPLPGGDVGTQGRVSASQGFGAPRDGGTRSHEGLDMTHWQGALDAPVAAYKTGKVVAAVSNGYNGYVEVDHGEGLRTLYYHTTPMVRVGEVVYGGQQIAKLYPVGGNTHLHFGISNNGRYTDPLPHVRAVKNKISTPLTKERAQQQSSSSSEVPGQGGFGVALSPVFQQPRTSTPGISIGAGGFNIDGRPVQTSAPRTQLRPSRSISQYASYERPQDQVIPVAVPIPQQMQQMMQGGSGGMMMSGPSEQDLLNSFYKRVLLNTVA